jgi:hypothetical protein
MLQLRRRRGSAISEFGPALFLLLVIVFFPMLDLLGMAAAYVMSGIYHSYMIRELSLSAPPSAAPDPAIQTQAAAKTKITSDFQNTSFFRFLGMKPGDLVCSNVTYIPNATNPLLVQCTTSATMTPFISIPWWGAIPGLNAPFTFTMTSQRPQEEKGRN